MSDSTTPAREGAGTVKIIYALYLAALLFPITGLVGVVMAYLNRGEAPDWLQSHYRFLIRTFWIGLLFSVIGGLTAAVLIGFLILLLLVIWLIIRCVKGLQALDKGEAVADPATWLF